MTYETSRNKDMGCFQLLPLPMLQDSQLRHPFVVSLHWAFQTTTHLFLVRSQVQVDAASKGRGQISAGL